MRSPQPAPGPRTVRFPVSFAFRVSRADADRLRAVAGTAGFSPSEWARKIISREAGIAFQRRTVRAHIRNAELLRDLLGELGRQGNNLNQMARQLNTRVPGSPPDLAADFAIVRTNIDRLTAAILAALKVPDDV